MDTIFALATAPGKSGVAVIRLSGDASVEALASLNPDVPPIRRASIRTLHTSDGVFLDQALVIVFAKKASFTGEVSVEIQCHGSPAVVQAILSELSRHPKLRQAEAGEFTRRALENGELDVAQVEGLADLLDAETEAQRRQALRVFSGELGRKAEIWRQDLIRAAALIEATIDFADEEVPVDVSPEVLRIVRDMKLALKGEINGVTAAERIRSGFEVAIVGRPNVGKSTLLNALAGRDAAITSEVEGTTRDVIEVRMDLHGLPVTVLDTAGLRESNDTVEKLGIERARQRASEADLRVFLIQDGEQPDFKPKADDIVICAKGDLVSSTSATVSGLTGKGVPELIDRITTVFKERTLSIGIATRLRHKIAMEQAVQSLDAAELLVFQGESVADRAAEELRSAIRSLDSLVGRIDVENVLGEIFASFCIGK